MRYVNTPTHFNIFAHRNFSNPRHDAKTYDHNSIDLRKLMIWFEKVTKKTVHTVHIRIEEQYLSNELTNDAIEDIATGHFDIEDFASGGHDWEEEIDAKSNFSVRWTIIETVLNKNITIISQEDADALVAEKIAA